MWSFGSVYENQIYLIFQDAFLLIFQNKLIIQLQIMEMNSETPLTDKTVKPTREQTSSSKKKYEFLWRGVLLLILALVGVVMSKVYIFQTDASFKDIRLGTINDLLIYGLPFAFVFSVFDWLVHRTFDGLCLEHYINWEKYPSEEERKKRCYTLVKWAYSIGYYLLSSAWAYKILMGTTYFPSWLGGRGDPFTFFISKVPLGEATSEMQIFYILQFGKHFSRFFGHVFIRAQGNFFEYALHHSLSVFLILFSYLSNYWWVGLTVLILHDYSDFALILARLYRDYRDMSKKVLDFIYVHAFIAWIGCRIILFNYICIAPAVNSVLKGLPSFEGFQLQVMRYPSYLMAFMMVMLEVLHIFWTYYIAESFVSVKVSSKVRHSYD